MSITVNGSISANGGRGGKGFSSGATGALRYGGGGSGGSIRLVAPAINGSGSLVAKGDGQGPGKSFGGNGRIRLEAFQRNFTGGADPAFVAASPFGLYLPTTASTSSSIRAVRVNGVDVPPNPTGSFTIPDVTINQSTTVTVEIEAHNIPLGTVAKVYPESAGKP